MEFNSWFEVVDVLGTCDEARARNTHMNDCGEVVVDDAFVEMLQGAYDCAIDAIASAKDIVVVDDNEVLDFLATWEWEGDETLEEMQEEFKGFVRKNRGMHPSVNEMHDCRCHYIPTTQKVIINIELPEIKAGDMVTVSGFDRVPLWVAKVLRNESGKKLYIVEGHGEHMILSRGELDLLTPVE